MRPIAYTLLAASLMVAGSSRAQVPAAETADDYVCALVGECPAETEAEPNAPREPGSPRVTATRGFSLSRTAPRSSAPSSNTTNRRTVATRPAQPPMRPRRTVGRVDLRLSFDTGSSVLGGAAQTQLRTFAEALRRPQLAALRIRIEGHTDSIGSRSSNLVLSQRRARSVADFLIAQGVEAARLEVRGFAADRPLPGRPASAGENRRVEAVRIS
jgi:OOP family OmpA-OmpF porin